MKALIVLIFMTLGAGAAAALVKDAVYDDLEGGALIEALIRDGKLDLARDELKNKKRLRVDDNYYYFLQGQYLAAKGDWIPAIKELARVSPTSGFHARARLSLARAAAKLNGPARCVREFDRVDMRNVAGESDYLVKAHCENLARQTSKSWTTLESARQRFSSFAIEREMIAFKTELNLKREAYLQALQWFGAGAGMPSQYLDIAEGFHRQAGVDEAIGVLEMGRSHFPMHLDINLTLSQLYFQKNMVGASEEGFARAASSEAKYFYHAGEVNRQMGRLERSQFFNGFVQDPKEKIKQKIAGYVDANKFGLIASLESVLSRSELAKDDEIKYAIAYSLVKMGQIHEPLTYLASITKPDLVEKTTLLRKTLLDCQAQKGVCHL